MKEVLLQSPLNFWIVISTKTMFTVNRIYPPAKALAQKMLPTLKEPLSAIKVIDDKYKNLAAK